MEIWIILKLLREQTNLYFVFYILFLHFWSIEKKTSILNVYLLYSPLFYIYIYYIYFWKLYSLCQWFKRFYILPLILLLSFLGWDTSLSPDKSQLSVTWGIKSIGMKKKLHIARELISSLPSKSISTLIHLVWYLFTDNRVMCSIHPPFNIHAV